MCKLSVYYTKNIYLLKIINSNITNEMKIIDNFWEIRTNESYKLKSARVPFII